MNSPARPYTDLQLNQYIDYLEARINLYKNIITELRSLNPSTQIEIDQVLDSFLERRRRNQSIAPQLTRSQELSLRRDNETVGRLYKEYTRLQDSFGWEVSRVEQRVAGNTIQNRQQRRSRRARRANRKSRRRNTRRN